MSQESVSLAGKTVLITGGARRVGAALARELHSAGANLVIHYRKSARRRGIARGHAQRRAARFRGDDPGGFARHGQAAASWWNCTTRTFGGLDVLVNNASTFYATRVGEITAAAWDDLMGTNLKVPLFLSQAAAPALRESSGLISNIVDIHALRPLRGYTVYCAAKAGLHMLTRSLAKELGPQVRVNGIAPGPVLWPEGQDDQAMREKIVERTILKRMGRPADIARTALFFAAHAPFITGQILAVDGGRSVAW